VLLVFDIGNTNIKTGVFENGILKHSWRMTTDLRRTADEYGIQIESFFSHLGLHTAVVDGIIMSSVMPSINFTIEHMCRLYFRGLVPMQVEHGLRTGITNRYEHPESLGADRLCNIVAAYNMYGGDCVVVDFGTATTFSVVMDGGEFLGGLICPGIKISTDALIENTAMLPKVEYIKPDQIVCANTEDAIRSGVINAYAGQVNYIIHRIEKELGRKLKVIATGGMSDMIASETDCIDVINPTLTLEGLSLIYAMNHRDQKR